MVAPHCRTAVSSGAPEVITLRGQTRENAISVSGLLDRPVLLQERSRSAAQMTIKEPDHHIECIVRLRNICVVKESVKETFPYI